MAYVFRYVDLIDRARPQIFMGNHQSVVDIGALVVTLPVSWRFVAKRELLWIPFFGWALGLGRHVIVDRGRREKAVASLKRAAERVSRGTNVILFPEGTRSRRDRSRQRPPAGLTPARGGVASIGPHGRPEGGEGRRSNAH